MRKEGLNPRIGVSFGKPGARNFMYGWNLDSE